MVLGECVVGDTRYRISETHHSYKHNGEIREFTVTTLESKYKDGEWSKVDGTYMSGNAYQQIMVAMLKVHVQPQG